MKLSWSQSWATETFLQYSLLEVMVINSEFSRLSSDNTKFLAKSAKIYMYLDIHVFRYTCPPKLPANCCFVQQWAA